MEERDRRKWQEGGKQFRGTGNTHGGLPKLFEAPSAKHSIVPAFRRAETAALMS